LTLGLLVFMMWHTGPAWRGHNSSAGGRPEKLSAKTKKKLVALVVKERGSYVVTRKFCKKRIPALRKVSVQTVGRALHDAGPAWLRRRMKAGANAGGVAVGLGPPRRLPCPGCSGPIVQPIVQCRFHWPGVCLSHCSVISELVLEWRPPRITYRVTEQWGKCVRGQDKPH